MCELHGVVKRKRERIEMSMESGNMTKLIASAMKYSDSYCWAASKMPLLCGFIETALPPVSQNFAAGAIVTRLESASPLCSADVPREMV